MEDSSRTSSVANSPVTSSFSWRYWLPPSVADLIFVALLYLLVFTPLSVKLLGDAGIGWHIRTGQLILATHEIPRVDPFSTQILHPWVAWEWLYDVAVGKLESRCGLNGVLWLTAVLIAAAFGWTFRLLIARRTNLFVALVLVLLAISASTIHFLARPHVFSWLFMVAWFWILDATESSFGQNRNQRRRLWILPVLMLVWVNVHGGFLLGFILLAIYWLEALWTWINTRPDRIEDLLRTATAARRVRDLSLVGVLCAIASLINPYGWKLHGHIYAYLTNRFLMDHIEEFQSPNFHGIAQKCFLALLLIGIAIIMARSRRLGVKSILILLFAVYAGLSASRNIPIASILLVLIVGPLFTCETSFSRRMTVIESALKGNSWPILAVLFTFGIALNGGRIGSSQIMDAHFDPKRMPVEAVNFLQHREVRSAILSPDYWGGYVIYRMYPHNKVVIDDRHDFYGENFLQLYVAMIHTQPGWDVLLRSSDCLLLPKNATLTIVIRQSPDWKAIYSDDVAVVFVPAREREDTDRVPGH